MKTSRKSWIIKTLLVIAVVLTMILLMTYSMGGSTATYNKEIQEDSSEQITQKEENKVIEQDPVNENKPTYNPSDKVVYLTFDDGPNQLTGEFLDVLKEHGVKATFFMQGNQLQNKSFQDHVKRAVIEGHYVGAHSMTHDYKRLYKDGQFVHEMEETIALINEITGTKPKLVRSPYGSVPGLENEQLRNQILEANIKLWDWTIDSLDWKLKNDPFQIVENIKNATKRDVEIVLMHEVQQTLQVLPKIITFFKERGYRFGVYSDNAHFAMNFLKDPRL